MLVARERGPRDVATAQRPARGLGGELGAPQRAEHPLARERIVEARGVADEQHATVPRRRHPVRERAQGLDRCHALGAGHASREVGELLDAGREERIQSPAPRSRVRQGNDEAHVDALGGHRVQDRVVGRVDEDLADVAAVGESGHIGHQRDPAQPVRPPAAQAVRDHRRAAVGADHERRADRLAPPVAIECLDTGHAVAVEDQIRDPDTLAKVDGQRAQPVGEHRVQD